MNHIVMYEPLIPQNTGNIMRTCVATNSTLHLIKPLGFSLDDKYMRRPGLDYIKDLKLVIHENYEAFIANTQGVYYFVTRYGTARPDTFDFTHEEDVYLIFGKETTGVPKTILKNHLDRCMRLPMTDKVRSLNVSNTAAIVIYEVLRQQGYPGLSAFEPEKFKGKDFLKEN